MKKILIILILSLLPLAPLHALDYAEEHKIAQGYISALDAANLIVYENELQWRIQDLANQLSIHIDNPYYQFKAYLLRDRSVNAFAIPDGHIFIHLGTILAAEDLDEISSVMAHEMGHCQLRHISRNYEASKKVSAGSIAGIIAGIVATTANPAIGSALIMSSMGGAQNIQLKYSRDFEYEADEFGRNIMQEANLDPSAQNRFMVKLRMFSGSDKVPEYFLTHPKTESRISAIQGTQGTPQPDKRFWELKAIAIGMLLDEEETMLRSAKLPEPYRSLAQGLMYARLRQNKKAIDLLSGIDLAIAKAHLGMVYYNLGQPDKAYGYLSQYHNSAGAALALAEIEAQKGDLKGAINTLAPYDKHTPRAAYNLGTYYEKVDNKAAMHVAFARYFYATRSYAACSYHIKQAHKYEDELSKETLSELEQMAEIVTKSEQQKSR